MIFRIGAGRVSLMLQLYNNTRLIVNFFIQLYGISAKNHKQSYLRGAISGIWYRFQVLGIRRFQVSLLRPTGLRRASRFQAYEGFRCQVSGVRLNVGGYRISDSVGTSEFYVRLQDFRL